MGLWRFVTVVGEQPSATLVPPGLTARLCNTEWPGQRRSSGEASAGTSAPSGAPTWLCKAGGPGQRWSNRPAATSQWIREPSHEVENSCSCCGWKASAEIAYVWPRSRWRTLVPEKRYVTTSREL